MKAGRGQKDYGIFALQTNVAVQLWIGLRKDVFQNIETVGQFLGCRGTIELTIAATAGSIEGRRVAGVGRSPVDEVGQRLELVVAITTTYCIIIIIIIITDIIVVVVVVVVVVHHGDGRRILKKTTAATAAASTFLLHLLLSLQCLTQAQTESID